MSDRSYWDSYYGASEKRKIPVAPSQFAAFVMSELVRPNSIILDFGCGNGRDSLFFARYNCEVIGLDSSAAAVRSCQSHSVPGATFIHGSVDEDGLIDRIMKSMSRATPQDTIVYARFFLHAISEESQEKFLRVVKKLIAVRGVAAFEFRTSRDMMLQKVTANHFRRFIDPLNFFEVATSMGFEVSYFTEGFGYAKYLQDDAHVARFILKVRHG